MPLSLQLSRHSSQATEVVRDDVSDVGTEVPQAYPVASYLSKARLPEFCRHVRFPVEQLRRIATWPKMPTLARALGTRPLKKVYVVDAAVIFQGTAKYMSDMPYLHIVNEEGVLQETSSKIKLANGIIVQYDHSDLDFLHNINSEDDMDRLLTNYVLATTSEVVRLFSHLPPMCPQAESLKFQNISARHTVHHCKWDVYSMNDQFFIVFVPPWFMGKEDLEALACRGQVAGGALDALDPRAQLLDTISDKLWALICDVCVGRCAEFVVTNYLYWSFGRFDSKGYSEAMLSLPIQAELDPLDGTVMEEHPVDPSVIEILVYWIQVARGAAVTVG
ncbi:uncharacterized protein BT62DRAFT_581217 [Guyanagaster necrorhizus]|uniref:Uncharacterized protein n=1 Tax=Guyanagaster necrorhizus TaxID=856835 RepID=A0A9P7VGG9_9AGAR|nr:uncharacterized protein BT62DRAFT_581217 [Guyanagaster necrorhizus MCA 3950]KAG7440551.1 hypothetical protein BT62DRAFT_581217 [Guyanagaster necrorhizus MCA 3950]